MNCCKEKPVIALPAGEKLCKNHFTSYFEGKVFKTVRHFNLIGKEENLGIALSGGKDSLTVLNILNKLSSQNPKIIINAIAIDEGILGYRDRTLKKAADFCLKNNIELHVLSYKDEFGFALDEMLKILDVKPCSICGVFRRYLLNKKSRELKLTKLATGHNLDDEAQSILMNQLRNNTEVSARLGPLTGIIHDKKFVQRIKPLYLCTEKEVTMYAFVNGLLDEFSECPNASQSFRAEVRDILNNLENRFPGTKYSIINSFLRILPLLKQQIKEDTVKACIKCGEPSANDVCNACVFLGRLESSLVEAN